MHFKTYMTAIFLCLATACCIFAANSAGRTSASCLSPRLKSSSSVSAAFAVIDPFAPQDASDLDEQPRSKRAFLSTDRDTTLRKLFIKQSAVMRDLKNSIESGMAVALPLGMQNSMLDRTLERIFSTSPEELATILQQGLHYDDEQQNAYRQLVEYLKRPGNMEDLKRRFKTAFESIKMSSGNLHARELVVLLDDNYDMFSMGFCLVHMGRFKQRDSIYIHKNILDPDSIRFVKQILEYADRCLEAGVMLNDIDNFTQLRKWWSDFMKKRFETKINELIKSHRQAGLVLASDIKGRMFSAESFSSLMGIWNEFRALEYLTWFGYKVKRAGTQVGRSDKGGFNQTVDHVLLEYDGLLTNENDGGVLVETKSWYFSVDDAKAHITSALVGSALSFDSKGGMQRRRAKMQRFYDLAQGLAKGHKFAGIPDDFKFEELIFVVADEEMRPIIEDILTSDFDVQVWVAKFAELGIKVRFCFMSDSFQINTSSPILEAGFVCADDPAAHNLQKVAGEEGQILLGRCAACFDSLKEEIKRQKVLWKNNLVDVASHVSRGAWFKLASLDYILQSKEVKMGSASFLTKEPGLDTIVNIAPMSSEFLSQMYVLAQGLSDEFSGFKHKVNQLCTGSKQSKRKLKKTIKALRENFNSHVGKKRLKNDKSLSDSDRKRLQGIRDLLNSQEGSLHSTQIGFRFISVEPPAYMKNANKKAYSAEKLDREFDFLRSFFAGSQGQEILQDINEMHVVVSLGNNPGLEAKVEDFATELNLAYESKTGTEFKTVVFEKQLPDQSWLQPQGIDEYNWAFANLVSKFQHSKVLEIVEDYGYRSYFKILLKNRMLAHLEQKGARIVGQDIGFALSADKFYLTDAVFQLPGRGGLSLLKTCLSDRYRDVDDFIENEIVYEIKRFEQRRDVINARIRQEFNTKVSSGVESLTYVIDVDGHSDWIPELLELEDKFNAEYGVNIDIVLVRASSMNFDVLDEQKSVEIVGQSLFPVCAEHRLLFEAA